MPSRVLSTVTCTFILFSILNVDVAGTTTPTPVSNSNNIIDYAAMSADEKRIDAVDPRFTMEHTFDKPSLSVLPCLMNALGALSELAREDFRESVETTTYSLAKYPTVSIVTNGTPTADTIEARFIIWGIWKGVRLMIGKNQFQNVLLTLKWKEVVVGYVIFVQSGSQLVISGSYNNQTLSERSEDAFLSNTTANSTHKKTLTMTDPTNNPSLTVCLRFFGSTLTIFEVFMSVLSALAYIAEFPKTQAMEVVRVSPALYDITVEIVVPKTSRVPLTCQMIIAALSRIPEYMVEQAQFREVVLNLSTDGIIAGEGVLARGDAASEASP